MSIMMKSVEKCLDELLQEYLMEKKAIIIAKMNSQKTEQEKTKTSKKRRKTSKKTEETP